MDHSAYLKATARGYADINNVCKDVNKCVKTFKELRPKIELFTHNNGAQQSLINLSGTIPVFYRGSQYNIPIRTVITDKHPQVAPYVYVTPTPTMTIRPGRHVDANGKVYLPYLSEWKKGRSDLKGLTEILCTVFGESPPVVARSSKPARPANPPSAVQTATPYPVAAPYGSQPPAYPQQPPGYSNYAQPRGPPNTTPYPMANAAQSNKPYPVQSTPSFQPYGHPYPSQPPAYAATNQPYPSQPPPMQHQAQQQLGQPAPIKRDDSMISQDVMLASLRDAVSDKIRRRTTDVESELQVELDTLKRTENELTHGKNRIEEITTMLDSETIAVENKIKELEEKCHKMKTEVISLESDTKIDPQEIIQPSTPIYKQIFNAHAREQALEDSIYHMNKALSRGTIDCDTFLRFVRVFAREQFEQKETVMKAREVARLRN